ncbi:hypothetical protein TNCV_1999051 [Trichonephila clavipes]|nr:hypothetical protein TNCV_1999051 [Trichonephila clavipes]
MTTSSYRSRSVELVMNKKQEHSVYMHAESWQRHPAAAALRRVFVTFFCVKARHCAVDSRAKSCDALEPLVVFWCMWKTENYSLPTGRNGFEVKLFWARD